MVGDVGDGLALWRPTWPGFLTPQEGSHLPQIPQKALVMDGVCAEGTAEMARHPPQLVDLEQAGKEKCWCFFFFEWMDGAERGSWIEGSILGLLAQLVSFRKYSSLKKKR